MEASYRAEAWKPQLVLDIGEVSEHLQRQLGLGGDVEQAYTELYSWRATDLSGGVALPIAASRSVLSGDVRSICGWSIAETTGAAIAAIRLRDGNVGGEVVSGRINLAAGESTRDYFPRHGIRVSTGRVFLEIITGTIEGVLYWR